MRGRRSSVVACLPSILKAAAPGCQTSWHRCASTGASRCALRGFAAATALAAAAVSLPLQACASDPTCSASPPSSLPTSKEVAKARRREQPAAGFHLESISAGSHYFDQGLAEGTSLRWIEPVDGSIEEVAWARWEDMQAEEPAERARGGACLFVPASPEGKEAARQGATVLFIHGGAFEAWSPLTGGYDKLASRFAKETKLPVVSPDFPLSGSNRPYKAPAIMKQLVLDALWLLDNDPVTLQPRDEVAGLVLVGDSSGATQVMSLLNILSRDHPERLAFIRGAVLISPWLDLGCGSATYISNTFSELTKTGDVAFQSPPNENRKAFRDCALTYLGDAKLLKDPAYSPYWMCRQEQGSHKYIKALQNAQVPLWMCIGHSETLMGEVLDFATRLRERLPMEVWLHEGMFHVWVLYSSKEQHFPSKEAAYQNMLDFVARVLAPAPVLKAGLHFYIDEW